MVRDTGSRLAGTTASPPVPQTVTSTSVGVLSTNYIDLKGLRSEDTIPRSIGEGGEEIGAKFHVGTAMASATATCKVSCRLVTCPRTSLTMPTFVDADVNTTTDVITIAAHGFPNGTAIELSNSGGALPAGTAATITYYVVGATTNTFQLALTPNGSAIDITAAAGGGTHTATWLPTIIADSGPLPLKRLGAGDIANVRVNPLVESPYMPRHRYLFGMVVPTATTTAGTMAIDLVNRPEHWSQFYPPAATVP